MGALVNLVRNVRLVKVGARDVGTRPGEPAMPGDALLPDAVASWTGERTIGAPPERVWPWPAQMGVGRGGFYTLDAIDNLGRPSAREIHPEWADLRPGDRIPTDDRGGHLEVLEADAPRALVLGGLWAGLSRRNVAFAGPRPLATRGRPGRSRSSPPGTATLLRARVRIADKGGFYSYTWLENLVGRGVRDAERVHPEWRARPGDPLVLHPKTPALTIVEVAAEPLGPGRTRIVSRYRCACSDDLRTRLAMGPALLEPIGFAMDRRMLQGIARRSATPYPGADR